jgi:hypothetical protein
MFCGVEWLPERWHLTPTFSPAVKLPEEKEWEDRCAA